MVEDNASETRSRSASYLMIAGILVAGSLLLRGTQLGGEAALHTILEAVAASLALVAGAAALLHHYSVADHKFLFLGGGLLGAGLLDVYHGIATSVWFVEAWPSAPASLAPWSWSASRLFLGMLFVAAWWLWRPQASAGEAGGLAEASVFGAIGLGTTVSVALFALTPLPRAYYPELIVGRPQELVVGALFAVALVGFFRAGSWRRDALDHWLVISLILAVAIQVFYMPFSHRLYDPMFEASHLLKILSYLALLAGLGTSALERFEQAADSAETLAALNRSLEEEVQERREAERELRVLASTLEARVAAHTRDLARTAENLARSNADLQQFAYVASHDLQEPLRMVSNFTELLSRRYGPQLDDDAREFIAFAVDGSRRMQQLIEDLLTYSRVQTHGREFEPVDVDAVLDDVLADLQLAIEDTGARITRESLPSVVGDRVQLRQLLQNLVANALKFTPAGTPPVVEIGANRTEESWHFHVRDQGIGIPAAEADRIFTIFQRLHGRGDYPGTGIGLSLCKRIVLRHGGRIWVDSQPGDGSTFRFTLPDRDGRDTEGAAES